MRTFREQFCRSRLVNCDECLFKQLGWKDEGIAWYVDSTAGTPVYRLYNPNSGEHVYTTNKVEYDKVGAAGWRQEGVAWQSLK